MTFLAVFAWSVATARWAMAAITGFMAVFNLGLLVLAVVAWRRGTLG